MIQTEMEPSEKYFPVLEALDTQRITTQRQLSKHSGISLGKINFLIKNFSEKGLIKIKNFQKNPNKRNYIYLLTPKGMEVKSRLAIKFFNSKLEEYERLRTVLAKRLAAIDKEGPLRFIFVGPRNVKELMDSVIKERDLKLMLIGHCSDCRDLKRFDSSSFDKALIFDNHSGGSKDIGGIPDLLSGKLLPLW